MDAKLAAPNERFVFSPGALHAPQLQVQCCRAVFEGVLSGGAAIFKCLSGGYRNGENQKKKNLNVKDGIENVDNFITASWDDWGAQAVESFHTRNEAPQNPHATSTRTTETKQVGRKRIFFL